MRTKKLLLLVLFVFSLGLFLIQPSAASAYTTGMDASVVLGQQDFTTGSTGVTSTTLNAPRGILYCQGKLLVTDTNNSRVLVWNSVPTTNGTAADVVIGQPDMTSNTANNGGRSAATLSGAWGLACAGNKLFISDLSNSRVLIYNSIPTTNGASADVVIGQSDFTTHSTGTGMGSFSVTVGGIATDGTKLAVMDVGNQRILIWNTIPTTNGVSADVVLGQPRGCTSVGLGVQSWGLAMYEGKLFAGDTFGNGPDGTRVLIWNQIPTTNNRAADVVIGQPNFVTCDNNHAGRTANSLSQPFGVFVDHAGRLLIADRSNHRILIYHSIPTANFAPADLALGQENFTSGTANQGGTRAADTLSGARWVSASGTQIFVSDGDNNRVLIFNNTTDTPVLTLNNSPEPQENGLIRLTGNAELSSTSIYRIPTIQFSVNGGNFKGVTAVDGNIDSTSEEFYFDFDPTENQQRDSAGNLVDGYTIRIKAINSNLDTTDNLFYFSPFKLNSPAHNSAVSSRNPTFDFSVVKQKDILKENLAMYKIDIKYGGADSTNSWQTLIDAIPIDGSSDINGDVTYEDDNLKAVYTDESSRIKVYSKVNSIAGSFQWRVVAIDKSGHSQDSETFTVRSNSRVTNSFSAHFPLAILNISGLGNPFITTSYLEGMRETYTVRSTAPIFYGIAFANSLVTLSLTDQSCSGDCTKIYSTIANVDSRFGINIPAGDLIRGHKYTVNMSVTKDADYNDLPSFTIQIN